MSLRIGLLLAGSVLFAQTQTGLRANVDQRVRESQRRLPPEVWSTELQPGSGKSPASYCVSVSPDKQSLTFRRCTNENKIRLVPAMKAPAREPVRF